MKRKREKKNTQRGMTRKLRCNKRKRDVTAVKKTKEK